jgi:putative FmdB family regulatory protein
MPIYEYNCEHCSYKFDKLVMSPNAEMKCPLCPFARGALKN